MEFEFSKHAKERLKNRRISMEIIGRVLQFPDNISQQDELITVYSKLAEEDSKSYLYRVFVNVSKKPPLVITAYKTSKIEKYGY